MSKIKSVYAREILDSRGTPTVEAKIVLETGEAIASVPSGASTGFKEAYELRDQDPNRFGGMGVLKAVENIEKIIGPKIIGKEAENQKEIDDLMISLDGTDNKEKLGGNATLAVSLAVARAASFAKKMPLYQYIQGLASASGLSMFNKLKMPIPVLNLINGGKHGAGNLEFQEFHVVPSAAKPYHEGLRMSEEVYQTLEKVLIRHGAIHSVGDEGGFAPNLFTNLDAFEVVVEAIKESNYLFRQDIFLGLDVAASHFFKNGRYLIRDRTQPLDSDELIEFYRELLKQYPLYLLEDPLYEDDWEGWRKLMLQLGKETLVVGDDLLCTNPERVKKAIQENVCNAILVKPNQIGTVSETLNVIKVARSASWRVVVSHRSGETNDTFIADFAVGVGADFVKFGAPARGERVAKYNRLLEIEEEITTKL